MVSPLKELPAGPKKRQDHWSTHFYAHVFTKIDEEKFAVLYDDSYSRPNKPANELVSLEIVKYLRGFSDAELEHAYSSDTLTRNALGEEGLGDNICPKTFTNFRRRFMITEVSQRTRNQTRFTGTIKVRNASIATALGRKLKRVSQLLDIESGSGKEAT